MSSSEVQDFQKKDRQFLEIENIPYLHSDDREGNFFKKIFGSDYLSSVDVSDHLSLVR